MPKILKSMFCCGKRWLEALQGPQNSWQRLLIWIHLLFRQWRNHPQCLAPQNETHSSGDRAKNIFTFVYFEFWNSEPLKPGGLQAMTSSLYIAEAASGDSRALRFGKSQSFTGEGKRSVGEEVPPATAMTNSLYICRWYRFGAPSCRLTTGASGVWRSTTSF